MDKYGYIIIPSILLGFLSRLSMLKVDYRQYPSYPQGVFSHVTLGLIAASLGAVAIPSLMEKEFSSVTFLSLAAQQFREVRNLERQSLEKIDETELVPRGTAYIEDISKAFEARNYMAMLTSLLVSIFITIGGRYFKTVYAMLIGIILGIIIIFLFNRTISRDTIEEIADVYPAKISFDGPLLIVNGVSIINIGYKPSRDIYLKKGIAVEIIPKDKNGVVTLSNLGQRKSIEHNVSVLLGVRKDVDQPDFSPLAARDPDTGKIVMAVVSMENDVNYLVRLVEKTIVLESAKKKPLDSYVGRKASD